jgi:hypothetical protein
MVFFHILSGCPEETSKINGKILNSWRIQVPSVHPMLLCHFLEFAEFQVGLQMDCNGLFVPLLSRLWTGMAAELPVEAF